VKNDNITVRIVRVQIRRIHALNYDQVANVQRRIKRMTPTVTRAILGKTHAPSNHRQHWVRRIQHKLGTIPEPENNQNNQPDDYDSLDILILPKLPETRRSAVCGQTLAVHQAPKYGNLFSSLCFKTYRMKKGKWGKRKLDSEQPSSA
jgi:hypothetical protein